MDEKSTFGMYCREGTKNQVIRAVVAVIAVGLGIGILVGKPFCAFAVGFVLLKMVAKLVVAIILFVGVIVVLGLGAAYLYSLYKEATTDDKPDYEELRQVPIQLRSQLAAVRSALASAETKITRLQNGEEIETDTEKDQKIEKLEKSLAQTQQELEASLATHEELRVKNTELQEECDRLAAIPAPEVPVEVVEAAPAEEAAEALPEPAPKPAEKPVATPKKAKAKAKPKKEQAPPTADVEFRSVFRSDRSFKACLEAIAKISKGAKFKNSTEFYNALVNELSGAPMKAVSEKQKLTEVYLKTRM